jgi:hypothetical protein
VEVGFSSDDVALKNYNPQAYVYGWLCYITDIEIVTLEGAKIETLKDLQMGIQEAKDHSEMKVLILTGSGEKAFVAGADIAEMKGMNSIEALNFRSWAISP